MSSLAPLSGPCPLQRGPRQCCGGRDASAQAESRVPGMDNLTRTTQAEVAVMPLWRSASTKVRLLQRVAFFEGLSPRQLGQVARLADEVEVPAGKHLATAGDTGRELFVIVEGRAVAKTPR